MSENSITLFSQHNPTMDASDYARRFYELAQREFESERELESAIGQVIDDMEREYFFGGLMKKVSAAGRKLLKKGVQLAKHHPAFQAVKAITQLPRGNLKGMLGNLAKAAIGAAGSAFPGACSVRTCGTRPCIRTGIPAWWSEARSRSTSRAGWA
jgi:hypothetical protein